MALMSEFDLVLDAAADPASAVCPMYLGPGGVFEDALKISWWDIVLNPSRGAAIFCNPPYSRKQNMPIEPWVHAMARAGRDGIVIGVIPYSPQTIWWRTYVEGQTDDTGQPHAHLKATEVRKFPFRLAFDPPPDYVGKASGANVNTAVVIWRPSSAFLEPWAPFARYWCPAEYHARG